MISSNTLPSEVFYCIIVSMRKENCKCTVYRIVLTDSYLYIKKTIKVYMMILFGFQTVQKLQSQSIKKDVFPL